MSRVRYNLIRTKLQDDNSRIFAGICKSARSFCQPAPILDFVWYPTATPLDPASFCFVASVRECPVKLLDASDGRVRFLIISYPKFDPYNVVQLRASYRIVDHRERQIAPHSLVFNLTAQKLVLRDNFTLAFSSCCIPDSIAVLKMPSNCSTSPVQEKGLGYTLHLPKRVKMA